MYCVCPVLNSEKENRALENFAIYEMEMHEDTHIYLGYVQKRQIKDMPKSCRIFVKNLTGD